MRWSHFILIQCLLIAILGGIVYIHKGRVTIIKMPPASLAQWYKPENKRQEWLHTMFKLRREIQAVELYASNSNDIELQKWVLQLNEHYQKIGDMVPEWSKKLDLDALSRLQINAQDHNYQAISQSLDDLKQSCDACHDDYRSITAVMYRAPDFASLGDIAPSVPLVKHMDKLIQQVNYIKIASEDAKPNIALAELDELEKGMRVLGNTCVSCHKNENRRYPDNNINETLASLKQSLRTGTLKDQGQDLGALAVQACARCHGTHRIAYDIRTMLTDKPDWPGLLRH